MRIFIFFLFSIGLISCNKTISEEGRFDQKIKRFNIFNIKLNECLTDFPDSSKSCLAEMSAIDSILDIEREMWKKYGEITILVRQDKNVKAIQEITNILSSAEYANLLFERGKLLTLRGNLYKNIQKLILAGEDYYQAANIFSQIYLDYYAASSYLDIANIHYNTGNYLLAIENGQIAQKYLHSHGMNTFEDSLLLMQLTNTMGLGYFKYDKLDSALSSFRQSNELAKSLDQEFWAGLTMGNMGMIYQRQGLFEEAINYYENDIRISLENKEYNSAATTLMKISEIYISNNELDSSRYFCDSAFVLINKSITLGPLNKYYEMISNIYAIKNQNDSALYAYKKHINLRDSLQSLEVNTQLQQIQNQKRFEQQLAEFDLLKAENELKKQELIVSYISISAVFIILLLVLGLLFTIWKKNRQLREMNMSLETEVMARTSRLRIINKELDTYLYRASHDVRRPILSILGLLQVAEVTNEAERGEIRAAIRKTANEMDKMLQKLRMAYLLEKQNKTIKSEINIGLFIDEIINQLAANQSDTQFEIEGESDLKIEINKELLEVIILNLVENASIYTIKKHSKVQVSLIQEDDNLLIRIKDQGIGLTADQIENMYDPYVRFSNLSNGSGIGLHLVQRAAKKLGVNIKVKSKVGRGTEFQVAIPIEVRWKKNN